MVFYSPADNVDFNISIGEVAMAVKPLEKVIVLGSRDFDNLVSLCFGDCGSRRTADAHVNRSMAISD